MLVRNWALFLALVAVCEGPLLVPKYLSVPMNILWLASFLFLLGSWQFHRFVSPSVFALEYFEMNWLIPRWETKWIHRGRQSMAVSPNAMILKTGGLVRRY